MTTKQSKQRNVIEQYAYILVYEDGHARTPLQWMKIPYAGRNVHKAIKRKLGRHVKRIFVKDGIYAFQNLDASRRWDIAVYYPRYSSIGFADWFRWSSFDTTFEAEAWLP